MMLKFTFFVSFCVAASLAAEEVISPIDTDALCTEWVNNGLGKCATLGCNIWVAETFDFANDGTYKKLRRTGGAPSSCSIGSNTFHLEVLEYGTYELGDVVNTDYQEITYVPKHLDVNPNKDNNVLPKDASATTCTKNTIPFLNDPVDGCPCNGTWVSGVRRNISFGENGCTRATCPNEFYFSNATRYGTARLTNDTAAANGLKLVLSEAKLDQTAGFADYTGYYTLQGSGTGCKQTADGNCLANGVMDGDETGVDCGGSCGVACQAPPAPAPESNSAGVVVASVLATAAGALLSLM